MAGVKFRILGPLEVECEDRLVPLKGGQQHALLALLVIHANERISADRLISELWGEPPPARAMKRVQVAVARLRKSLAEAGADGCLRTVTGGYRLSVEPGELDADVFRERVAAGRRALQDEGPSRAAALLREAIALWRGPALSEVAYEAFAQAEIRRLEELHLEATELRIDADLADGRHHEVIVELEALVAEHPLRERLHRARMLALYRSGRQADALEAFREARSVLVTEAGVEPGRELRELQAAILRHDVALDLDAGLAPELDPTTEPPLAGRERELAWLRERWDQVLHGAGALLTITGPPGIGKTRLAAELAAEVHGGGASAIRVAPTEAVSAARRATRPTLLVVDDADSAGANTIEELRHVVGERPVLALVCAADDVLDVPGGLTLEPLDGEAVRAIVAEHGPRRLDELAPFEWLLHASGGVPGRLHELVGQWARQEAVNRVEVVAGRAAAGRAELRSIESELAGDIVELRAVDERSDGRRESPVVCPFKGLAAFEAADAAYFFGRERLVAQVVARLVGAQLMGLVGPSGSGKSSLLRAGLLPALADGVLPGSEHWRLELMRPGEHPMRELAGRGDDEHVLLAVDQFEEVFTACRDEQERAAFIDRLADLVGAGVVVLALRADYYGRCAAYPRMASLLAANHVLVGSMDAGELREAIERPAQRVGLRVEPELTAALLADVEGEPGALPLLSTALLELWQRREGRRLALAGYERSGGVRGAVARLAETAFRQLDGPQQAVARSVMLRLVGEGTGGAVVRRRIPLAELETERDTNVEQVVSLFTDRRLLTAGDGAIEVAHEALLREWPRLRDWVEEDADGRRLHRRLTEAARDWETGGSDPAELYRGARLASALDWRADHEPDLNRTERAFLDASAAAEERELVLAARRARRLRALALSLFALVIVTGGSALVAVREGQRAESERSAALSRSLAVQALAGVDRDLDWRRC